jgi:hypothetical protein
MLPTRCPESNFYHNALAANNPQWQYCQYCNAEFTQNKPQSHTSTSVQRQSSPIVIDDDSKLLLYFLKDN